MYTCGKVYTCLNAVNICNHGFVVLSIYKSVILVFTCKYKCNLFCSMYVGIHVDVITWMITFKGIRKQSIPRSHLKRFSPIEIKFIKLV